MRHHVRAHTHDCCHQEMRVDALKRDVCSDHAPALRGAEQPALPPTALRVKVDKRKEQNALGNDEDVIAGAVCREPV
eukprot:2615300-Rhodomonas_salina.1